MFQISVLQQFSAAHHLAQYPGACALMHGHNWEVEVFVEGDRLNDTGILLDFRQLREAVREVVDPLDHSDLNTLEAFKAVNPTSESIARYIFKRLAEQLNCPDYHVARVTVRETPGSMAAYWEEPVK